MIRTIDNYRTVIDESSYGSNKLKSHTGIEQRICGIDCHRLIRCAPFILVVVGRDWSIMNEESSIATLRHVLSEYIWLRSRRSLLWETHGCTDTVFQLTLPRRDLCLLRNSLAMIQDCSDRFVLSDFNGPWWLPRSKTNVRRCRSFRRQKHQNGQISLKILQTWSNVSFSQRF